MGLGYHLSLDWFEKEGKVGIGCRRSLLHQYRRTAPKPCVISIAETRENAIFIQCSLLVYIKASFVDMLVFSCFYATRPPNM